MNSTFGNRIPLAGASIVLPSKASETLRYVGCELSRYLYLLSGRISPVVTRRRSSGEVSIALSCAEDGVARPSTRQQAFRIVARVLKSGRRIEIRGASPVGTLYGVYELLERLGMGFFAGGETFPDGLPLNPSVPADLDFSAKPLFEVRGNMLHYNFLCGVTAWGLEDYKFYFDQLARMRCNMLLMHWYDNEPGAACEIDGEYVEGGITPNSLTKPWGALAALRTSEFSFDSGRVFDAEIWSSPMGEGMPHLGREIKDSEAMFAKAVKYARQAGIQVAAGFEIPRGDPTDPGVVGRFKSRVRQFLARYPDLTHLAIWQREGGACSGTRRPERDSSAWRLFEKKKPEFECLGHDSRIWEAIRTAEFAGMAARWLAEIAPEKPLVLVGWGGDRWMRFADLCLAFDRLLPPEVIFTCHENIDASWGPNVSSPWGELPPERKRWAMPWVEGDISECWVRQPNVESLAQLAPDALGKGCQGLLTLQWRTRDVEEETAFAARFAWDRNLDAPSFYDYFAERGFGKTASVNMASVVAELQRMGSRWTGVRGSVECGAMVWTGHAPHYPFNLDGAAVSYLAGMADEASEALSIVPDDPSDPASFAFHLRRTDTSANAKKDRSRYGVNALAAAAESLRGMAELRRADQIRARLFPLLSELWEVRSELIRFGMTTQAIRSLDGFMIALHHMGRNAGADQKIPKLRRFRQKLERLRSEYEEQGRLERLERLDYLAATMDFVLHYDPVAMRMAENERLDKTLAGAARRIDEGLPRAGADLAAETYRDIVRADMPGALQALAGKLTTRCDWGVLATFNVKAMPLYWSDIGKLEKFMPVPPPRFVQAQLDEANRVRLCWRPAHGAVGQKIYRRRLDETRWRPVRRQPLSRDCRMFVDAPPRPGQWKYAVSSLGSDQWESPLSHPGEVDTREEAIKMILRGCKPAGRIDAGEDFPVRVIAESDFEVDGVFVLYRAAGDKEWRGAALAGTFRNGYAGNIPAEALRAGIWEFCVMGMNRAGDVDVWPLSAGVGLPWTFAVMS